MGDITIQKLKALSGQYDPDLIYKLPLGGTGLSSLPECISMCPNLTVLDVSFNSICSVEALAALNYLKTLIIVSNKIERLDSFSKLLPIEQIYLQNNKVKSMAELNHLAGLPNLKVLSLQSLKGEDRNPVCDMSPTLYRDTILRKIPQLQVLDEARASSTGLEFYGAVREDFDLEAEMTLLEKPTWATDLPWKEKPLHVKVQLDTTAFKAGMVGCTKALAEADAEVGKAKERLRKAQEQLDEFKRRLDNKID